MSGAATVLLLLGDTPEVPYVPPSYPIVASVEQSTWTDNGATSHPVTMPSNCNAGDLKLVFFDNDIGGTDVTVTTPAGWTQLFTLAQGVGNRLGVYAKVHVGGDPATVDFVTSTGRQAAAQAFRITNWKGTIAGGCEANTPQSGTGASPNPSSFSPTFGAGNNLWITVLGDSSVSLLTTAPSGYSDPVTTVSTQTTAGAQVYSARKTSTAATEDPGAWTFASGGSRVYSTIAIAPAA